jgi:putative membrane protein
MNTIIKLLLTAVAVVVLAKLLPGVTVAGYGAAVIVAIVLALLRLFVKPILVVLTLPITILTLGLFLFIINAIIVWIASELLDGFSVRSLGYALLFSILLSIFQSLLNGVLKEEK